MSHVEVFVESTHDESGRSVIFEDDGVSAWLYLTDVNTLRPVSNVWVYNRVKAPVCSQMHQYEGCPPPAAQGFASAQFILLNPHKHDWEIKWSQTGEAAVLLKDGVAIALVLSSQSSGYSKGLLKSGPWGKMWSNHVTTHAVLHE